MEMKWKTYFFINGFGFKFEKKVVWRDEFEGVDRGTQHIQIGPFNWMRKIKYEGEK